LFRGQQESAGEGAVQVLPIADVRPNPEQPRQIFSEEALAELAGSIRAQGVLQPILVRPLSAEGEGKYEIVAGERRWRASQMAGQQTIPVMVREMSAEQALAIALIENLQREDLNPMEEAAGFRELRDRFGLSQDEISSRVGKSRSAVANTLRLFNLPEEIQDDLHHARMTQGHARPLLAVDSMPVLLELRQYILEQAPSVRDVEGKVAHWKQCGELPQEVASRVVASKKSPVVLGAEQLALQEALSTELGLAVRISGTLHKGRVSIVFNSSEELAALNSRLGLK
jgi:ParB family chromosome partitioning protein